MSLDPFFDPNTVAVIGASRESRKFGRVIFKNFLESEFEGNVYPVNPKAESILGVKTYPSLKEIPEKIDLAVIALPAPIVPSVVEECLSEGVKAAVIISGGFKEVGGEGEKLELEIKEKIEDSGLRVIGPNCIGIYDSVTDVDTLFLPSYKLRRPKKGPIAFISQSGAFGSAILDWAASQEVGISKFVSIGNKMDVDEVDLLEYLSGDPNTSCIAIYVESIDRGRDFLEVASEVVEDKSVVVLKGGVTQEGIKAALSHTGSLGGSAKIYEGAFKQSGVIQARKVEELFDYARALAYQPIPDGQGVAIVTNGGGFGVISSDEASRLDLNLVEFEEETLNKLEKELPYYAVPGNPLDLVGDADVERYRMALNAVSSDPNVDIILAILLLQTSFIESDVVDAVTEAQVTSGKPIVVCTIGGEFTRVIVKMLEEDKVPSYPTPERAVGAVDALIKRSEIMKNFKNRTEY